MMKARKAFTACLALVLAAAPSSLAFAGELEGGTWADRAEGIGVSAELAVQSAATGVDGRLFAAGASAQEALDPANLEDGVYQVPVTLTKADSIDDETMPSVFLAPNAILYVSGSDRRIVVTLQTASIMGADYNADGLFFYSNESYSVDGSVIVTSSGAAPASQVLSYRDDPSDKYHHYPQDVMGAFPAQAAANGGYLAVSMGSATMSSSLLCLKCDWGNLSLRSSGTPELPTAQPAEKTVLDSEIAKAKSVQPVEGRASGYDELQREIGVAEGVSADASASQDAVDSAAKSLHGQADAYRKADLKDLYDAASQVEFGKYTSTTRAELSRRLTAAKAVLDDGDAADEAIAAAYSSLKEAYDNLEVASVDKAALGGKIDEASGLAQGKKSTQAYAGLQAAIGSARLVYDDDDATQGQVNDALVSLTNAVNAFKAAPDAADEGDGGSESGAIEPGMLYRATGSWAREDDPLKPSMMASYLESSVCVCSTDEGLEIRITPTADGDKLISAMYSFASDGKTKVKADVVSDEGAVPRQYRIKVDGFDDPVLVGADAAMGTATPVLVKALLSVDVSGAAKVDPHLQPGSQYQVPVFLYEQGTYATAGQKASPLGQLVGASATVVGTDDGYIVRLAVPASEGVEFRRLVYGAERAKAAVVQGDDGSLAFEMTLSTLSDAVPVGFTLSENGSSSTRYADLVLHTAQVSAAGGALQGPGDDGPGDAGTSASPEGAGDSRESGSGDAGAGGGDANGSGGSGGDGAGAAGDKTGGGNGGSGAQSSQASNSGGSTNPAQEPSMSMYRLYNPYSGEHFYTSDAEERDNVIEAGWTDEGVGWVAPETSSIPVYRLYNQYGGEHHYTLDAEERDSLVAAGWTDEGIGWYSDEAQTVALHREYNPNEFSNNHNYTADLEEHEGLVAIGWIDEGIGWYAVSDGKEAGTAMTAGDIAL